MRLLMQFANVGEMVCAIISVVSYCVRLLMQFAYVGEMVCAIISVVSYCVLRQNFPSLSKDAAISVSAEASLFLVVVFHNSSTLIDKKNRAARMCMLCTISCSSWLMCIGNRSSSNVLFEAAFIILVPFVSGLMKTAFAWYIRHRDISDPDIDSVSHFYWLHLILVIVGVYSLQHVADVHETKNALDGLNMTMHGLNTAMNARMDEMKAGMVRMDTRMEALQVCLTHPFTDLKLAFALLGFFLPQT